MNRKQITIALSVALTVLVGGLIVAGQEYKCTATTQKCLDMMVDSYKKKAWLGLEYEWEESTRSMRITQVMPNGPGLKAGFQVDDRVIALEGWTFIEENEAKMAALEADLAATNQELSEARDELTGAKSKSEKARNAVSSRGDLKEASE